MDVRSLVVGREMQGVEVVAGGFEDVDQKLLDHDVVSWSCELLEIQVLLSPSSPPSCSSDIGAFAVSKMFSMSSPNTSPCVEETPP